jgi:hypothetical protein
MGALALTYKEQYKSPFLPVMPGHVLAEYNNLDSAAAVIMKGKTAAVFVEPVQVRLLWVCTCRNAACCHAHVCCNRAPGYTAAAQPQLSAAAGPVPLSVGQS